jgi:hypothetical protein
LLPQGLATGHSPNTPDTPRHHSFVGRLHKRDRRCVNTVHRSKCCRASPIHGARRARAAPCA